VFFILLSSWVLPGDCSAVDRCKKYKAQVIREAHYHIGLDAPYWLFLGQMEQESGCRPGVTAFDGGKGLGQFMPATAEWIHDREEALREISVRPSPYDARWSIRALILYDKYLYGIVSCNGWCYAFRAYNGGQGLINREIRRAGSCDQAAIERQCRRRVIRLKNGSLLDLCRVNIDYPRQIEKRGEKYR